MLPILIVPIGDTPNTDTTGTDSPNTDTIDTDSDWFFKHILDSHEGTYQNWATDAVLGLLILILMIRMLQRKKPRLSKEVFAS